MIALLLLPLALVPLVLVEASKAARWRVLFGPTPPPYRRFLQAHIGTLLANALAPVRAGEVVGVGVLASRGGGVGPAVVSLSLVKMLDALALALIATAVVGWPALASLDIAFTASNLTVGLLIIASGTLAGVVVLRSRPILLRSGFGLKSLRSKAFLDPLARLRDPRTIGAVVLTSALVWILGALANAILLLAFGVPPTVDLAARILVSGYLVSLVPAPPAKLGVFEAGVGAALLSGGVPAEQAISMAVGLHILQFVTIAALLAAVLATSRPPRDVLPAVLHALRSALPGRPGAERPQPVSD